MLAMAGWEIAARIVVVVAAVAVLADSLVRARTRRVGAFEERIFRVFNDAPDALHVPVWIVMQAGSLAAVWVVAGVLWAADDHAEAIVTALAGTAVWAGVKGAKRFVGRGRPGTHLDGVRVRGQAQTGLGYPSGHAAVSTTLALLATEGAGAGLRVAAVAVAVVTGCARMYVGAHLPLDVAGGFAVGVVVAQVGDLVVRAVG